MTRTIKNADSLGVHQKRLIILLSDGYARSAADISASLHISDPRGVIRDLRKKGYEIFDYWVEAQYGGKYKRYYMKK